MLPDYLHSAEADHFAFIRVPKILLQNEAFHGISVEAKLLYSLLFDRTELSNKNGWRDDQDRVYIIFTVAEIQENLNCGNKKAIQLLDELENKAGLIERKRQGLGKPNLIYVKSFYCAVDNSGERHFLKCQNDTSGSVKTASLEVSESHSNKTNNKKTYFNNTDPSFLPGSEPKRIDGYAQYGLPLNRALRDDNGEIYDVVAGSFLVVGLTDEDFGSLSPNQMKTFEEKFHSPEVFIRMGRGIMAVPLPDEKVEKQQDKKLDAPELKPHKKVKEEAL